MASSFPGGIDNFTDPLANSSLASPSHAGQHSDLNDAVEKIETYMGLVKVIPTGAVNGTVGTDGTVTIGNAVSSVSLNNCFSSGFNNYRIAIEIGNTSASMSLYWRFRVSGSDDTNPVHQWTYMGLNNAGTTLTSWNAGQTYTYIGVYTSSTGYSPSVLLDVCSPYMTQETRIYNFGYYRAGMATLFGGVNHTNATSFDGFTIYPSAGTLTGGTIRVYGYRN